MTHKEFVIWLKGFAKAANPYNVTPAQWDAIVEELNKIEDEDSAGSMPVPSNEIWYSTTTYTSDDKTILHD